MITYNAASVHVRRPGSQKVLELIQEMQLKDLEPDVITYSAAISACEKVKQSQKALELLEEMRQNGMEPNVITYNAASSAREKVKQSEMNWCSSR